MPATAAFEHRGIDLDELQSSDSAEIVRHKLHQAYDIVNGPVVVEDVGAGLDEWNGLPGPFIKFFIRDIGKDSLHTLGGDNAPMTVTCTIGYYDGRNEIIATGTVHGKAVSSRGDSFGFDVIFMPDGHDKTYAEMTSEEKDAISHRHLAVDALLAKLEQL